MDISFSPRLVLSPLQDGAHEIFVTAHAGRQYLGLLTVQSEDR